MSNLPSSSGGNSLRITRKVQHPAS